MPATAALGFKLHTGWAAVVAATGPPAALKVLFRSRLELLPSDDSVPRFVYHKAAELSLPRASELVKSVVERSHEAAELAVAEILRQMKSLGVTVRSSGVPGRSRSLPNDLAAILKSHALIHAAEGALFQQAVIAACESNGIPVIAASERELWARSAAACDIKETALRRQVDGLRKTLGAPWTADYKNATALALLALQSTR